MVPVRNPGQQMSVMPAGGDFSRHQSPWAMANTNEWWGIPHALAASCYWPTRRHAGSVVSHDD